MLNIFIILFLMFLNLGFTSSKSSNLSLKQYIEQVEKVESDLNAAKKNMKGANLAVNSADLLSSIQFISRFGRMDDARETINPGFQGTRTIGDEGAVGFQQRSTWGINWALTQNYRRTSILGANPAFLALSEFTDTFPKLELSIPLWKDRAGASLQAQIDQMSAQAKAQELQSEILYYQKLNEVESAYWNLILQEKLLKIKTDNLQRSQKLFSWMSDRRKKNLVEDSDYSQTEAAVTARKIELEMAEVNFKESSRQFNKLRHAGDDKVTEKLVDESLDLSLLDVDVTKLKDRKEIEVQRQGLKVQEAQQKILEQNIKPTLDLNMSGLIIGRDKLGSEAYAEMYEGAKYMYQVGIQFSYPLDMVNSWRSQTGLKEMTEAQGIFQKNMDSEQEVNKKKVRDTGLQLKEQIKLARSLAQIQKKKLDIENQKYRNGRSLLFQVLSFEQDYVNAQVQQLELENQARGFINQLRFYN